MESSIITMSREKEQQQEKQKQFDLETQNKIAAEIQALLNREGQQQQDSNTTKNKFIKFSDGQRRRLSFQDFEKKQVQNKDYATGELIPDSYSTRYFFYVVDQTMQYRGYGSVGIKKLRLYCFGYPKTIKSYVERHGKSGDKLTTYISIQR
jgi:hypothetical protein